MDCAGVAGHLVAYHVGTVSNDERDAVEAHLVACASCVKTYLALKRAADLGSKGDRPSTDARARLRANVARAFPASKANEKTNVAIFARRIPLYQGVALAAIAAAIAIATPSVLQKISQSSGDNAAATNIDTSRTKAESLAIY